MRYHYEKPTMYRNMYGETYVCDHPVYSKCTLFKMRERGFQKKVCIRQSRFDK